LRQDQVALKVEEGFSFLTTHRPQTIRYGGVALALAAIVAGTIYYRGYAHGQRQQALADAIQAQNAPVGSAAPNGGLSFPTDVAKHDAIVKAYARVASEYSGSAEGYIAEYTLGAMDAEAGKGADARKKLQDVADHADAGYASLARLSLAQLDFAENKTAEAQALLKDLMDHPTELVSKNQATFTLARGLTATNPAEARKLLVSLASVPGGEANQAAVTALQELPPQ